MGLAAALVLLYQWGRRDGVGWVPLGMRVVAVLGLILPVWTVLDWYRELSRVEEWSRALPVDSAAIADRFLTNSMALMFLGFLVMVGGIYLARRIPTGQKGEHEG